MGRGGRLAPTVEDAERQHAVYAVAVADPQHPRFREMPGLKTVVAFEESSEEVEGHYFYVAGDEFRVIRLDSVILSFPTE